MSPVFFSILLFFLRATTKYYFSCVKKLRWHKSCTLIRARCQKNCVGEAISDILPVFQSFFWRERKPFALRDPFATRRFWLAKTFYVIVPVFIIIFGRAKIICVLLRPFSKYFSWRARTACASNSSRFGNQILTTRKRFVLFPRIFV